jgi:hypothetical protein
MREDYVTVAEQKQRIWSLADELERRQWLEMLAMTVNYLEQPAKIS